MVGVCRSLRLLLALVAAIVSIAAAASAQAQQTLPATPPPGKVQELIKLLDDPEIRAWLQTRPEPAAADVAPTTVEQISRWEALIRDRFASLFAAAHRLGSETASAATIVVEKVNEGRRGMVIGLLALLVGLGYAAEWLFRLVVFGAGQESRVRMAHAGPAASPLASFLGEASSLLVFTFASAGVFLAFEWPPLLRQIVLTYLLAFVMFRAFSAIVHMLLAVRTDTDVHTEADIALNIGGDVQPLAEAPVAGLIPLGDEEAIFWTRRLKLFAGYFLFGWATVSLMPILAFSPDVTRLVAYLLGLGLLAIAIEMVWRRPGMKAGALRSWLLTIAVVVLWLLWVVGLNGLLWVGIYALLLPKAVAGVGKTAQAIVRTNSVETLGRRLVNVLIVSGARALVIAAAVAWLAYILQISRTMSVVGLSGERIMQGMLQGIVVLLVADLLWQLSRAFIDFELQAAEKQAGAGADKMARRARLRTLLPIFRNALAAFIGVVAMLTVLSGLGIQIAPLIAGAGIFGVAIGFGSQTLVKDILSGVFFMLDDAFRVGEYIESGSYMGTVESFSLRSVRLRHHRGPVFTVPFGDLGAVKNMSRDWVIEKMSINVTYDTDIELARKLVKQIGRELAEDPEFKASIIEPLKMQGVDSFGDFAMVIKLKMMTKPNEQFTMKRKALLMIRKAFEENGIKIAVPTVHVSGGGDEATAAASETLRMRKAAEAAAAGTT
jgi:small-conductance mechanosensitive channel